MKLKYFINIVLLLLLISTGNAQVDFLPGISIVKSNFNKITALQSFVVGMYQNECLLIGGRTEGLHRRQPFAAFDAEHNNTSIYVFNIESGQIWTSDLSFLPLALQEQLQSSNMQFHQDNDKLTIIGGYGFSNAKEEHVTYNGMVQIDISKAIAAVKSKKSLSDAIRFGHDDRLKVCGGQLGKMEGYYYLVGGQNFEGSYNPNGPDHGPGFTQEYTNAIRKFKIVQKGDELQLANFSEQKDSLELHRRDFNLLPQIFYDGTKGFTAFSGVFQYKADIPWLNTVDIRSNNYTIILDFEQKLNQYHDAKIALFDETENKMYNFFLGGISRFYQDSTGNVVDDMDVPFVKTISLVTRNNDGEMSESTVGYMPDFLGASAEFIPAFGFNKIKGSDVLKYNKSFKDSLLLGYIIGGIKSSANKIFWSNEGEQSEASNQLYKVYLTSKAKVQNQPNFTTYNYFKPSVYPNDAFDHFVVEFTLPHASVVSFYLNDSSGKQYFTSTGKFAVGFQKMSLPIGEIPEGNYLITIDNGEYSHTMKLIK